MADTTIVRGKTLPNSGVKNDLHELIDLSTVTVANIVDADVSNTAAIAGTKINPNFGAQAVTISSFTAFPTTPEEAPDADYEVANKKYVDDNAVNLDGYQSTNAGQVGGSSTTLAHNTVYQASTDGFVVATYTSNSTAGYNSYIFGYTGTTSSPSTLRASNGVNTSESGTQPSICMPVTAGLYWKVLAADSSKSIGGRSCAVYFMPLS